MLVIIFSLFVLYTLACVADGQDVKPMWQSWLGDRLLDAARKYKTFHLCNGSRRCQEVLWRDNDISRWKTYVERLQEQIYLINATRTDNTLFMIEHNCIVPEEDVFRADIQYRMFGDAVVNRRIDDIVEETSRKCVSEILNSLKEQVAVSVDRESHYPAIVVKGSLILRKC